MKNAKKQQHSRYGLERNFSLAIRLAQTTGAFPHRAWSFFYFLGHRRFREREQSRTDRQAQRLFIVHLQTFAFMDGNPK